MGLIDKFKKILFDEDEVEIPIGDELPERQPKPKKAEEVIRTSRSGFIDYSETKEKEEEDIIKEVVVPKEDKEEKEEKEKEFSFPIIDDFSERNTMSRSAREESISLEPEKVATPRRDYSSLINSDIKVKKNEEKDYRSIIKSKSSEKEEKKPFKVTPVISPVYGYIEEPKEAEMEYISVPKKEIDPSKPRMFGPVSYNDEPLPMKQAPVKKEEINDLTQSIIDLAKSNPVIHDKVLEEEVIYREEQKVEENYQDNNSVEEDIIIETPNYDDYEEIKTSGIENEYLGNNNIEDAFESTSELERINYEDEHNEVEKEVKTDDIINEISNEVFNEDTKEDEDAHLDDTIETDLFNLIDSMYKSNDEDEIEED